MPRFVALFGISLSSLGFADSALIQVIRYDTNGRPQVQQAVATQSVVTPQSSSIAATIIRPNAGGQSVVTQESTATTTQPSANVQRSESSTQVRDSNGNLKTQSKTIMTETKVSADTTKTETDFQEARSLYGGLTTTAKMRELKKETSTGETYERVIEKRTGDGDFRPRQKVEGETQRYSDGSERKRSVESMIDLNGNALPVQEVVERHSPEYWGKQTTERIIKKIEPGGDAKLDRVEIEERNSHASSGVIHDKVVKQPDSSYGLRETQRVTTFLENPLWGSPYKKIVTKECPRNNRFGDPVVTQVEIEKTVRRSDGSSCVEKETKVRDVNGNLKTVSVSQTETKGEPRSQSESE